MYENIILGSRVVAIYCRAGSEAKIVRHVDMSATDVGWAPPEGVKDNKEENDALAWKGVAIATLMLCSNNVCTCLRRTLACM